MMLSVRSLFFVLFAAAVLVLAAPVLEERSRSVEVCGVRRFKAGDVWDAAPLNSVYSLKNKSDINKETKSKVGASLSHRRAFLTDDIKSSVKKDYAVDTRWISLLYAFKAHYKMIRPCCRGSDAAEGRGQF